MSKVTRFSAEALRALVAAQSTGDSAASPQTPAGKEAAASLPVSALPVSETEWLALDGAALQRLTKREDLAPEAALALLRHPLTGKSEMESLFRNKKLHPHYEFRLEFTRHPKTLAAPAVQFLRTLHWRDQYDLGRDAKAAPLIQRTAQTLLIERIPEISLGEQITLARIAWPEMIPALMATREEKVLSALLDNPRFREGNVVHLLEDASLPVTLVERIARHHRWAFMHRVRALLIRDPRLATQAALRLMKGLPESELNAAASHPETSKLRGLAARRMAGKK